MKKISIVVLILLILGIALFFIGKKQNVLNKTDGNETTSYYDVEF